MGEYGPYVDWGVLLRDLLILQVVQLVLAYNFSNCNFEEISNMYSEAIYPDLFEYLNGTDCLMKIEYLTLNPIPGCPSLPREIFALHTKATLISQCPGYSETQLDWQMSIASGFWYTNLAGSSPELFWSILWVPRILEILRVLSHRTSPSRAPAGPDGVDARVGQPKTQLRAWALARPPGVTLATDLNTDPSCGWNMDQDIALGSSLGLDDILTLGGKKGPSGGNGSGSPVLFISTSTYSNIPLATAPFICR
ncbi:thymic stromal lymphopoietin [Cricetulus griseus]